MKAVIDTDWLDQQIEGMKKNIAETDHCEDRIMCSAVYAALIKVRAQLSPIKEHIEDAFDSGRFKSIDIDDYLKQNGYE